MGLLPQQPQSHHYDHVAKDDYPIGSGEVEAADKVPVTRRLKPSGQSLGQDGGQGVLAYRGLLKSDRSDRAWCMRGRAQNGAIRKHKRTRSKLQQMIFGRSAMPRDSLVASTLAQVSFGNPSPIGSWTRRFQPRDQKLP